MISSAKLSIKSSREYQSFEEENGRSQNATLRDSGIGILGDGDHSVHHLNSAAR